MVSPNSCFLFFRIFQNFSKIFRFWLRGAAPQDPRFLAEGPKPPRTPPLNDRSSHLIEAAKRGRLDQMISFSAPLTTRGPPTTVRWPSDDRPPAVRQPSMVPMILRYLLFLPEPYRLLSTQRILHLLCLEYNLQHSVRNRSLHGSQRKSPLGLSGSDNVSITDV